MAPKAAPMICADGGVNGISAQSEFLEFSSMPRAEQVGGAGAANRLAGLEPPTRHPLD
jgi:hypothetical protein